MSASPMSTIPPPSAERPVRRAASAVESSHAGRATSRRACATRWQAAPYLFLLPYFLTCSVFFIYPLVYATVLAFYQTDGPARKTFVGLDNFRFVLFDTDFHRALWNTSLFTVCSIFLQLPLSLALALLLNRDNDRLKGIFRLVIFAPNLVGHVFVGILFAMLFTPRFGLINKLLHALVGWGLEQQWLQDPSTVLPAVIIASLWLYVGFNMVYFLAALQNVDQSLVEAARIDGASPWEIFLHVTIPAIAPVATFVVVTSTIGSFQLFELPYTMLQNTNAGFGPDNSGLTIVGYLYRSGFESGDLGTAAAVGWLLTCIIFVVSLVQIRLASRVGDEG